MRPPPTTGRASSPPPSRTSSPDRAHASSPSPSSTQSAPCRSATHDSIGSSSQLRSTLIAPPRCRERSTTISNAVASPCMLHHAVVPPILKLPSISDNVDSHAYQSRIHAPLAVLPCVSAPPKHRITAASAPPRPESPLRLAPLRCRWSSLVNSPQATTPP